LDRDSGKREIMRSDRERDRGKDRGRDRVRDRGREREGEMKWDGDIWVERR
jgi:hypothetical protein